MVRCVLPHSQERTTVSRQVWGQGPVWHRSWHTCTPQLSSLPPAARVAWQQRGMCLHLALQQRFHPQPHAWELH